MSKIKKLSVLFLCLLMLFSCPLTALASENETTEVDVEYFDDGSYLVTETTFDNTLKRASTKSATRRLTYFNANDVSEWYFELSATFSYTGSSVTCTRADVATKIYNDQWKVKDTSSSKSGGKATGTIEIKYTVMGVTIKTVTKTLILTCSRDGTII